MKLSEKIIKEAKKPLSPKEIWKIAESQRYKEKLNLEGRTISDTIKAEIYRDIKENPDTTVFKKINTKPTQFYLKSLPSLSKTEERMARLCWNFNNWKKPSGSSGKSTNKGLYEYEDGFGHEEWLFDFEKLIDGYHYGFIEPVRKERDLYIGQNFNILLYTYEVHKKCIDRYWVGRLNNVEVISPKESIETYEKYKKEGWLKSMQKDLSRIDIKCNKLSPDCFNIKFLPSDADSVNNGLKLFSKDQNKIFKNKYRRYTFYNYNKLLNLEQDISLSSKETKIEIVENEINDVHKKAIIRKSFAEYSKEYENTHGLIQCAFYNYLQISFPNDRIWPEAYIRGLNCFIDLYQEKRNGIKIMYEIKTYMDLRFSIRIAIGQLLEYAYYPNREESYKLIIVSNKVISDDIREYITNLNNIYRLNIGVINFDFNTKIRECFNCDECDFNVT
jgi:hypothetical protein